MRDRIECQGGITLNLLQAVCPVRSNPTTTTTGRTTRRTTTTTMTTTTTVRQCRVTRIGSTELPPRVENAIQFLDDQCYEKLGGTVVMKWFGNRVPPEDHRQLSSFCHVVNLTKYDDDPKSRYHKDDIECACGTSSNLFFLKKFNEAVEKYPCDDDETITKAPTTEPSDDLWCWQLRSRSFASSPPPPRMKNAIQLLDDKCYAKLGGTTVMKWFGNVVTPEGKVCFVINLTDSKMKLYKKEIVCACGRQSYVFFLEGLILMREKYSCNDKTTTKSTRTTPSTTTAKQCYVRRTGSSVSPPRETDAIPMLDDQCYEKMGGTSVMDRFGNREPPKSVYEYSEFCLLVDVTLNGPAMETYQSDIECVCGISSLEFFLEKFEEAIKKYPCDNDGATEAATTKPTTTTVTTTTVPPKTDPPRTEPPKTEPPTTEPPKIEPPRTEPPKTEPPPTEPPKTEPPKTTPPKTEPPTTEPPNIPYCWQQQSRLFAPSPPPPRVNNTMPLIEDKCYAKLGDTLVMAWFGNRAPPKNFTEVLDFCTVAALTYNNESAVFSVFKKDIQCNCDKLSFSRFLKKLSEAMEKYQCNNVWTRTEAPETVTTRTEPPRTEPPRTIPPRTEAPRTEPPRTEPPKTEAPRTVRPKTEAPMTVPPRTEPPMTEAPRTEVPMTEPPKTEPPRTAPPRTEVSMTLPPETVPPNTEAPRTEVPMTVPPRTEPPKTEAPRTVPPKTEAPMTEVPMTGPSRTEVPMTEPPKTEQPRTAPPRTEVSMTLPPETVPPKTEAPRTEVPMTGPSRTEVPMTVTPETGLSSTVTSKTEPPKTTTEKRITPRTEVPKTVPPRTGPPMTVPPGTEAPTTEAPMTITPRTEQLRTEQLRTDQSKTVTPKTKITVWPTDYRGPI